MNNVMNNQLKNQLHQWQRANAKKNDTVVAHMPKATHNPYIHTNKLHGYVAIVEYPIAKGGGYSYYKNRATVRGYEQRANEGYKVTWL